MITPAAAGCKPRLGSVSVAHKVLLEELANASTVGHLVTIKQLRSCSNEVLIVLNVARYPAGLEPPAFGVKDLN